VFKETMAVSPVLRPFEGVLVWLLPSVEFLIVILLLVPNWRLYGFYGAFVLMIMFTVYVAAMQIFDKGHPCGCGGIIEFLSLKQHIVMNGILLILQFIGIRLQRQNNRNNNDIISFRTLSNVFK
jgi:uncharacterized membrane protein YphA (DoxX/SURF4 family)